MCCLIRYSSFDLTSLIFDAFLKFLVAKAGKYDFDVEHFKSSREKEIRLLKACI